MGEDQGMNIHHKNGLRGITEAVKSLVRSFCQPATGADTLLWQRLRGRRLAGCRFHRRVAIGSCRVDFVCFDARLIVEVDGDPPPAPRMTDTRRTAGLRSRGYDVMRFREHEIRGDIDSVIAQIQRRLREPY